MVLSTRTITTQRLADQPQSINIVLGESYGLWPFLGEYNGPGAYLVEQGRKYAASPQAMSTQLALAKVQARCLLSMVYSQVCLIQAYIPTMKVKASNNRMV